ncbi:hypothetical protein [Methylocystis silviterrae]|uniref:hypothetical protein n=1 Tax=Methylocystis silviterrae TaxID=2743612 RepID=UPI001E480C1C|nr:hypothetical protein [Methylocystis silviterrae]
MKGPVAPGGKALPDHTLLVFERSLAVVFEQISGSLEKRRIPNAFVELTHRTV